MENKEIKSAAENIIFEEDEEPTRTRPIPKDQTEEVAMRKLTKPFRTEKDIGDHFEFEEQELAAPTKKQISLADELEAELKDDKYYFTPESFNQAQTKLRCILADFQGLGDNYPPALQRLMKFVYVYPIYEKRKHASWVQVPLRLVLAVLLYFGADLSVSIYDKSGLIMRFIMLSLGLSAVAAFGYMLASALFLIRSYILCEDGRVLFATKALYTEQGNCRYLGKDKDGKHMFEAEVKPPFQTSLNPEALFEELEEQADDAFERNGAEGSVFYWMRVAIAFILLLVILQSYHISLIDYIWFLW